eukprot:Nk52_evm1s364 gene=Nk52_evmTU1s364
MDLIQPGCDFDPHCKCTEWPYPLTSGTGAASNAPQGSLTDTTNAPQSSSSSYPPSFKDSSSSLQKVISAHPSTNTPPPPQATHNGPATAPTAGNPSSSSSSSSSVHPLTAMGSLSIVSPSLSPNYDHPSTNTAVGPTSHSFPSSSPLPSPNGPHSLDSTRNSSPPSTASPLRAPKGMPRLVKREGHLHRVNHSLSFSSSSSSTSASSPPSRRYYPSSIKANMNHYRSGSNYNRKRCTSLGNLVCLEHAVISKRLYAIAERSLEERGIRFEESNVENSTGPGVENDRHAVFPNGVLRSTWGGSENGSGTKLLRNGATQTLTDASWTGVTIKSDKNQSANQTPCEDGISSTFSVDGNRGKQTKQAGSFKRCQSLFTSSCGSEGASEGDWFGSASSPTGLKRCSSAGMAAETSLSKVEKDKWEEERLFLEQLCQKRNRNVFAYFSRMIWDASTLLTKTSSRRGTDLKLLEIIGHGKYATVFRACPISETHRTPTVAAWSAAERESRHLRSSSYANNHFGSNSAGKCYAVKVFNIGKVCVDVATSTAACESGSGREGERARGSCSPDNEDEEVFPEDVVLEEALREVLLLSNCAHENIVDYHGSFFVDDDENGVKEIWLIMEYCEKKSVQDVYEELGVPLDEKRIAKICRDILKALADLHSVGKAHRDVKCSNILLDEKDVAKLADFGCSCIVNLEACSKDLPNGKHGIQGSDIKGPGRVSCCICGKWFGRYGAVDIGVDGKKACRTCSNASDSGLSLSSSDFEYTSSTSFITTDQTSVGGSSPEKKKSPRETKRRNLFFHCEGPASSNQPDSSAGRGISLSGGCFTSPISLAPSSKWSKTAPSSSPVGKLSSPWYFSHPFNKPISGSPYWMAPEECAPELLDDEWPQQYQTGASAGKAQMDMHCDKYHNSPHGSEDCIHHKKNAGSSRSSNVNNIGSSITKPSARKQNHSTKPMQNEYTLRADIWSLGISAIEMAELAPPRYDLHPLHAIELTAMSEPPRLTDRASWSPDFRDFLSLCLRKRPQERPSAAVLLHHSFIASAESQPLKNEAD